MRLISVLLLLCVVAPCVFSHSIRVNGASAERSAHKRVPTLPGLVVNVQSSLYPELAAALTPVIEKAILDVPIPDVTGQFRIPLVGPVRHPHASLAHPSRTSRPCRYSGLFRLS